MAQEPLRYHMTSDDLKKHGLNEGDLVYWTLPAFSNVPIDNEQKPEVLPITNFSQNIVVNVELAPKKCNP